MSLAAIAEGESVLSFGLSAGLPALVPLAPPEGAAFDSVVTVLLVQFVGDGGGVPLVPEPLLFLLGPSGAFLHRRKSAGPKRLRRGFPGPKGATFRGPSPGPPGAISGPLGREKGRFLVIRCPP
jgi:hypothetical protein